jgi:tubulin epsilon
LHSLGGGTGSGLGTYIVKDLADLYPTVFRFNACVFPSNDDDVITSPYNSMLALNTLIENSDCILPVDN